MTKYVLDTFAWIEYLIASKKGTLIKEIIESQQNEIFTSLISISEAMSIAKREGMDYSQTFLTIINLSKIYEINLDFAKEAGLLHADIKVKIKDFGLADTFILLTARKLQAKVVTGNPHFKSFKNEVILLKG